MIGRVVAHYEILAKLGEGGMGVLYKARDTHLDRLVALKILPADRVADPERRRRFVQEARAASALNHPHIVTVYDIDEADGVHFIAMEHVEGTTLADRIGRRGLPLQDALKHAAQIADALAQAHAKGIVHRDLKPANVMLTAEGVTKVLDFGLAKLVETEVSEEETTDLKPATDEGTIVGTAAYMSPEQAQGRRVDARSDIFSFGSLLYEMVTGRRAFSGESKVSTLAAILKEEPRPPSDIVPALPRELERLIQHCMRKDPSRRFQHMDDVRTLLEQLREDSESGKLSAAAPVARVTLSRRGALGLGVIALVALALAWLALKRPTAPDLATAVVATPLTAYAGIEVQPTFSPDGNEVAFVWNGEREDNFDIYRKLIGPGEPLRLTRDPHTEQSPAWSPDGRLIAFLRERDGEAADVYLVPALGGAERRLAGVTSLYRWEVWSNGLAWTPDGKWLVVADQPTGEPAGLFLLSPENGDKRRLTSGQEGEASDWDPAPSPDGRLLAFTRRIDTGNTDVYVLGLGSASAPQGTPDRLTFESRESASPVWLSSTAEILLSQGAWLSERQMLRLAVDPLRPAAASRRQVPLGTDATNLAYSKVSQRLVFSRKQHDANIYRLQLRAPGVAAAEPERLIASTRLDYTPEISPDGASITFVSTRSGSEEIWLANVDGSDPRQLTSMGGPLTSNPRWSPNGRHIVFDSRARDKADLYLIGRDGGAPRLLTDHPSGDHEARWSNDGRFIYFGSDRTGREELWKMAATGGEATQVTRDGGCCAVESPDGRWLYYSNGPGYSLWRAPAAGGAGTRVLSDLSYGFNYVPTNEGVYFVREGQASIWPTHWMLEYLDLATGRTRSLLPGVKSLGLGLSLAPDGRSLFYSRVDSFGADLILVDNLR